MTITQNGIDRTDSAWVCRLCLRRGPWRSVSQVSPQCFGIAAPPLSLSLPSTPATARRLTHIRPSSQPATRPHKLRSSTSPALPRRFVGDMWRSCDSHWVSARGLRLTLVSAVACQRRARRSACGAALRACFSSDPGTLRVPRASVARFSRCRGLATLAARRAPWPSPCAVGSFRSQPAATSVPQYFLLPASACRVARRRPRLALRDEIF